MMEKRRVGILISGRGSNMAALVEATRTPGYPAEVVLVLSNRPDAKGLMLASEAGIDTTVVDHKVFGANRRGFESVIDVKLRQEGVELVCLAGFMRVLTPWFIERWAGRLINIHPSLLPAFPGLDTHRRALAAGETRHGCTVHHVVSEVDAGPVIMQAEVPVLPGDTADSLAARVLEEEHKLYPAALRRVIERA